MTSIVQTIPGTRSTWADSDLGAPVLLHPLQSAGSLYLYEPARTDVTVPTNGARTPNVLARTVAPLIPGDTAATWGVQAPSLLERSRAGGIHAALAATNMTVGNGVTLRMPDAVKAYIRAHLGHEWYFSFAGRTTRAAANPDTAGKSVAFALLSSPSEVGIGVVTDGYVGTYDLGFSGPGAAPDAWNAVGVTHRQVGSSTLPASIGTAAASSVDALAWMVANVAFNQWADRPGASGAKILYYAYAEDLTVSGRTYAQVAALDRAYLTAQVATGGLYAGDTWTAPPA